MNDIIIFLADKYVDALNASILSISSVKVMARIDFLQFFSNLMDNPIIDKIIKPILLILLGFVLKNSFDKYFSIVPKLYLKLGNPLHKRHLIENRVGYELTWIFECSLKNNSKYDCYNIEISESLSKPFSERILNHAELKRLFPANFHLESNKSLEFEIKKTVIIADDVLSKTILENGQQIILPGIKIQNPHEKFEPKGFENIKLIIKYENEKGKKFYTKFTRRMGEEKNKVMRCKPFKT